MTDINETYKKIQEGSDLDEVRSEIISLIKKALEDFGENINNWQKAHISDAIGNLACNITQKQKDSNAWLTLSLVNIKKSYTPEDKRNDSSISNADELEKITHKQLINVISSLS